MFSYTSEDWDVIQNIILIFFLYFRGPSGLLTTSPFSYQNTYFPWTLWPLHIKVNIIMHTHSKLHLKQTIFTEGGSIEQSSIVSENVLNFADRFNVLHVVHNYIILVLLKHMDKTSLHYSVIIIVDSYTALRSVTQ